MHSYEQDEEYPQGCCEVLPAATASASSSLYYVRLPAGITAVGGA